MTGRDIMSENMTEITEDYDYHLVNPKNTIQVLKKYDIHFQKKYGQNFLIDSHVMNKIIKAAEITKDDLIIEIGPGIGTMTQFLCEAAREVIAIEIDKALIPVLSDTLSRYDNVRVIEGDVLRALADRYNKCNPVKIVANLPYYITTPIIMGIFEKNVPVKSITVMVQKEVAERMQAGPGTKAYGALSLAVQYYARPYLAANVPENCFMPRPNVASAVISLDCYDEPKVKVYDVDLMFRLIRASFQQRRKTLINGISNSGEVDIPKEKIISALEKMGLDISIRGEKLTLEEFATLSNMLA